MGLIKSDHNRWLVTLTAIALLRFYLSLNFKLLLIVNNDFRQMFTSQGFWLQLINVRWLVGVLATWADSTLEQSTNEEEEPLKKVATKWKSKSKSIFSGRRAVV